MWEEWNNLMRMVPEVGVATICGGLIGIEREMKNKVAGIRTHILICVGVAIFTNVGAGLGGNTDPTRVIGQIVTGIGFLGAGVIYKQSDKIVGVTSAAFIWFVAAIGVLCGVNYLLSAGILTVFYLLLTIILKRIEFNFLDKDKNNFL
jgi:putative Mg2+ transporter-C (MgtC) family protein